MGSKLAMIAGIAFLVVAMAIDHSEHGHFDDEAIRESVEAGLDKSPDLPTLHASEVKVRRRTVHVRGSVDSIEERIAATRTTLETPGILTVVNDVRVDALLEPLLQRLKEQVEADPTDGAFDYRVSTDGHAVTLEGWVPEGEEDLRAALEATVREVPGVRRLINNLGIGRPREDLRRVQELILEILRLKNIYFDYNKATIRKESQPSIGRIAGVLQEYPDVRVRIEGHTDSIASERYNQALSERRSEAVVSALVEHGVSPSRLEAIGFGELQPIAPNRTPEGRAENRRIEFNVLNPNEIDTAGRPAGRER